MKTTKKVGFTLALFLINNSIQPHSRRDCHCGHRGQMSIPLSFGLSLARERTPGNYISQLPLQKRAKTQDRRDVGVVSRVMGAFSGLHTQMGAVCPPFPLSSYTFIPFPTMPGAPLKQLRLPWVPASGRRQFIY